MKPSATTFQPAGVLETALYAGDDLRAAETRSRLGFAVLKHGRAGSVDWLARLVSEATNVAWHPLRARFCEVTGREVTTGEPMTIHFHGNLKVVDFCARHLLGTKEYTVNRDTSAGCTDPDVVVDYHRLRYVFLRRRQRLFLPHRISQYLPLGASWAETLNALPSHHRRELARHLRNYRITTSLCAGRAAVGEFFDHAFRPYALHRFGAEAYTGTREAFLLKHRNAVVLWVSVAGIPCGANLLCRSGDTLNIEHCGATVDGFELPGLFDCIDYFSLLFAQVSGCRELDFGGSRPHLENGILRYKAKWNTRIRKPKRFSPQIRILIARESEAVRGFLMRNLFLQFQSGRLIVKLLSDGSTDDAKLLDRLLGEFRPPGIDEWLVVRPSRARTRPPLTETQRLRSVPTARAVASYLET